MAMSLEQPLTVEAPVEEVPEATTFLVTPEQSGEHAGPWVMAFECARPTCVLESEYLN